MSWYRDVPWGTYVIDLRQSEEVLWKNIKKETRKNIKKLEKNVFEVWEDHHWDYYNLLTSYRERLRKKVSPRYRFRKLASDPNYHTFLVVKENPISGIGLVCEGDTVREQGVARSMYDVHNCQDYLKWFIICWAKKQGFKYYDLAGVNPQPKEGTKDFNIKRYKEKFGGTYKNIFVKRNILGIIRDKVMNK